LRQTRSANNMASAAAALPQGVGGNDFEMLSREQLSFAAKKHSGEEDGEGLPLAGDLSAMFPGLDPRLVRTVVAETRSKERALQTLFALAASSLEPSSGPDAWTVIPQTAGLEDPERFPPLSGLDGWQFLAAAQPEGELTNDWRDRALRAAELPEQPSPSLKLGSAAKGGGPPPRAAMKPRQQPTAAKQDGARDEGSEVDKLEDCSTTNHDYELRRMAGQQRRRTGRR